MNILAKYANGNSTITIHSNGTRIVESESELKLDYPLNIDVRLSRRCALGLNNRTGKAVCSFCHESATTDGDDASIEDIKHFFQMMKGLPEGTEIALGINQFSAEVYYFLVRCKERGLIVNATVNQGTIRRDESNIDDVLDQGLIHGLGISYRKGMIIPKEYVTYENTVFHVIAGIDTIHDVKTLVEWGVKKILILGEKDFGFNLGKVKIKSFSHVQWYRKVHELFDLFEVVSFDNLALEQLNIRRFVKDWDTMYQHEFSFYANIVDRTFSPSSRSSETVFMKPVMEYFKEIQDVQ